MSLFNLLVKKYCLPAAKSEFITTLTEGKHVSMLSKHSYFHGYMAEFTDENILLQHKALHRFFGGQKISHVNTTVFIFICYIKQLL